MANFFNSETLKEENFGEFLEKGKEIPEGSTLIYKNTAYVPNFKINTDGKELTVRGYDVEEIDDHDWTELWKGINQFIGEYRAQMAEKATKSRKSLGETREALLDVQEPKGEKKQKVKDLEAEKEKRTETEAEIQKKETEQALLKGRLKREKEEKIDKKSRWIEGKEKLKTEVKEEVERKERNI